MKSTRLNKDCAIYCNTENKSAHIFSGVHYVKMSFNPGDACLFHMYEFYPSGSGYTIVQSSESIFRLGGDRCVFQIELAYLNINLLQFT